MNNIKFISSILVTGLLSCTTVLSAQQKDSVVVGHFSTDPAWSSSAAISKVDGKQLEKTFTQNVLNTLYGEIPGLTVMSGSGEPGADGPSINARGYNTLSSTSRGVLVLVDGFENTLDNLTVYEIESVQLLKDAAAAAIYGMKAANGVLLVNTKRGSNSPLRVNFSAQAGVNTPLNMPQYLDAYNYAVLFNEARANDGLSPVYDDAALEAYKNGTDKYLYPNVNWQEELLKNYSFQQSYNLNFRGGNKTVQYFTMLGITDNNGIFKGTDPYSKTSSNSKFTRYHVRGNIDVNITDRISAHLNLYANIADQAAPAGGASGYFNKIANIPANAFPVYNPDGSFGGNSTFSNPLGDLLETGLNSYNQRNIQSALRVKYSFAGALKGLSMSIGASFANWFRGDYNKTKKYPYFAIASDGSEYIYQQYSEKTSMSVNDGSSYQWRKMNYTANVDYNRLFDGKHLVNADVQLFSDTDIKQTNSIPKDNTFPYRYVGARGRLGYGYAEKYTAEFTWSYMGTDLYAPGKRFGFFPAASLGWIASNEDFLKDNSFLTYLKLRASYGQVGHASYITESAQQRYAYLQYYKYSGGYYRGTNNGSVNGMMEDSVADINRTWERENRLNVGADLTLGGKFDLGVDYFLHKRSGILVPPTADIPGVLGMSFAHLNLGRATNHGMEVTAGWHDRIGSDFEYYVNGKFWYAKNTLDFFAEEIRLYPNLVRTGLPIGQPFGLEAIGLFRDQAEIDASPEQTFSTVKPGDIKYRDVNEDGRIDNQDVTAIGKLGTPDYTGSLTLGFRWKGFDFETMFYGVTGRTTYLSGNTYWAFMNQYGAPASAVDRWTEDRKDIAEYPRLSTQANPNNTQYSSFWQRDGSFLKLKYVEFGYSFPMHLGGSSQNLRVFVNGTNLFTLHKLGAYYNADPEGISGYPRMRTFSAGIKFQL